MSWILEITRGDNGYKLKWQEQDNEEGQYSLHEEYIEDLEEDELKSGESLLWWVMEYFGFGGSKHDVERIGIIREKKED